MLADEMIPRSRESLRKAIERRVRKELRVGYRLDLSASYVLIGAASPQGRYLADLLDHIYAGRLRLRILAEGELPSDGEFVISPKLLEEDTTERFASFLAKVPFLSTEIRPLRLVSVAELSKVLGDEIPLAPHPLLAAVATSHGIGFYGFSSALRSLDSDDALQQQETEK